MAITARLLPRTSNLTFSQIKEIERAKMDKKNKTDYCIKSVEHALDILEQFQGSETELGISELSKRLNLHKNKIFRLLATLVSHNYIEQNETMGNYCLGAKNLQLGLDFSKNMGLLQQAKPVQEVLVRKCTETSYISVLKNFQTVNVSMVESDHSLRVVPQIGVKLPLHCTAAGKVLAININEENLRNHFQLNGLKKYTDQTIDNPDTICKLIRNTVKTGYAIDNEELDEGVKSIGAPIRDYTRQIIGALSISVPTMRLTSKRTDLDLVPLVMAAANEISFKLGFL